MANIDTTDWTSIRPTDKNVVPIGCNALRKCASCILVTKGNIRDAVVSGYFQVAYVPNPNSTSAGKQRKQVICYLYGKKPKTTWMNLTVSKGGCADVKNYTGEVISNIGRN